MTRNVIGRNLVRHRRRNAQIADDRRYYYVYADNGVAPSRPSDPEKILGKEKAERTADELTKRWGVKHLIGECSPPRSQHRRAGPPKYRD